ncbi:MAG: hypothetical protein AAFR68_16650 [Pseudomonadota bacterium]
MLDFPTIHKLGPNEMITEPGFYELPIERHHGQPCDGISITSSKLRKIEKGTPADVWATHPLNPDRYEDKDTDALRMGRAMALFIEGGPEKLEAGFWVLPHNKPRRPTLQQVTAYNEGRATEKGRESVEFWRDVEADPRDVISEDEWDLITSMGRVLAKSPDATAALGGTPEVTMAWRDEINDLWCLARPDQLSFDGMLSDYKKVNTQGRPLTTYTIDARIDQHAYDMQMAFAAEGFHALTGVWPSKVGLIFQWDQPPYHVVLRAIDDEDLQIGAFLNREARALFRHCLDTGNWFGPGEVIGSFQRNPKAREALLERMQKAGTAP